MKNKIFFYLSNKKLKLTKFNKLWKKLFLRNIKKYTSKIDIHGFSSSYIKKKQLYLWSSSLYNIRKTQNKKISFKKIILLKKILYYIKNIYQLYILLFNLYYSTLILKKNKKLYKNIKVLKKKKCNSIIQYLKKLIYFYISIFIITNYKKLIKTLYNKLIKILIIAKKTNNLIILGTLLRKNNIKPNTICSLRELLKIIRYYILNSIYLVDKKEKKKIQYTLKYLIKKKKKYIQLKKNELKPKKILKKDYIKKGVLNKNKLYKKRKKINFLKKIKQYLIYITTKLIKNKYRNNKNNILKLYLLFKKINILKKKKYNILTTKSNSTKNSIKKKINLNKYKKKKFGYNVLYWQKKFLSLSKKNISFI